VKRFSRPCQSVYFPYVLFIALSTFPNCDPRQVYTLLSSYIHVSLLHLISQIVHDSIVI